MNHLEQAKHNYDVLSFLNANKPDDFFDWKITITFYIAHHLIKELSKLEKKYLPPDHSEMLKNINPENPTAIMPIDKYIFDCYQDLYQTSRTVRYNELYDNTNLTFITLKKASFGYCTNDLNAIIEYLKSKKIEHFSDF